MASINKTIDKDMGGKRIISEAKNISSSYTEIGVHGDAGEHIGDGEDAAAVAVTIAEVAFWNEFGTITAPERSFMRSTIDENRKDLERETAKLLNEVVEGRIDAKMALDKLGLRIQELIKQKILELNDPPNAPSTIARKGFNNPLVDSRQLWRSIAFKTTLVKKAAS